MSSVVIDARIISSSTGRYVERLLHYLQDIDTVNIYYILLRKKDMAIWHPKNDNFISVEADFPDYSLSEQFGLLKILNKLKPDLVHFCMPQQPVLYKGKSVVTIHDLTLLKVYNSDKNWLQYHVKQLIGRGVFAFITRKNTFIISPTEYTKQEIIDRYTTPASKISVTLLAADTSPGKTVPYKQPYKQFIMYVGQQSDYKNIKRLGDAHQKLLEKYPDLGLILVGRKNKSVRINEEYFEKKGYKNILFTDFIPDEQRDWLYTHCNAYIFPSLMEGFGLPGLEAMGYGAPVVSSNRTCLPEVYADAAHYFNPEDINDIAQKIDDVLRDKKFRDSLIKKGYARVKEFSWRRTAEQTHAIYMKALEKK